MSALLEVRNVTKTFGGLTAVNNVSFDVADKEILSVIGPNGAGKSTLFKLISSFLPTTSGEVLFKGERISNLAPHIVAQERRGAHLSGDHDFQEHDRPRQCHRLSSSAIQGQSRRLFPRHRRRPA